MASVGYTDTDTDTRRHTDTDTHTITFLQKINFCGELLNLIQKNKKLLHPEAKISASLTCQMWPKTI